MSDCPWGDVAVIVIDNGSHSIKVGYAGQPNPAVVIDSGMPLFDEAGVPQSWEQLGALWRKAFKQLGLEDTEGRQFLITEPLWTKPSTREALAEFVFEDLKASSMCVRSAAELALYGSGKTTGLCIDAGHSGTRVVPFYDGVPVVHAIQQSPLGGHTLDIAAAKALSANGFSVDEQMISQAKEAACMATTPSFTLPNGTQVSAGTPLAKSLSELSDVLFADALDTMAINSIKACEAGLHQALYANVVLTGGTTMLPGFAARLTQLLHASAPDNVTLAPLVARPLDDQFSAWIGGSTVASLTAFEDWWVTRDKYRESPVSDAPHPVMGVDAVHAMAWPFHCH